MTPKLKCVMLIDDDRLTNFLNKIIIDKSAITDHVERCESVQSAVNYFTSIIKKEAGFPVPELIFLDMRMPEQSGWKFIEYYKSIKDELPQQPVIILLSALEIVYNTLVASNVSELAAFYSKPLTPELLNQIINEYFG